MLIQLAQKLELPGAIGVIEGPLNRPGQPQFTNLASVVSEALKLVFPVAGVLLLAYLVWGGFEYLTSMGEAKETEAAQGKITNAIIGFIIIFVAFWVVQIFDFVFKLGYF